MGIAFAFAIILGAVGVVVGVVVGSGGGGGGDECDSIVGDELDSIDNTTGVGGADSTSTASAAVAVWVLVVWTAFMTGFIDGSTRLLLFFMFLVISVIR